MSHRLSRGFTLIELLVVIAIIALLSSVVFASVNTSNKKARIAQRKLNLRQLVTALELYKADKGSYPLSTQAGCPQAGAIKWCGEATLFGGKGYTGATGYIPNLAPNYISILPKDPMVNNTSCNDQGMSGYTYISNGSEYKIANFCTEGLISSDAFYDTAMGGYDMYVSTPAGATYVISFFM